MGLMAPGSRAEPVAADSMQQTVFLGIGLGTYPSHQPQQSQ